MAGGVMTVVYLIFFSLFMGGLHSLQYLILLSLGLGASVGLSQGGNFSRLRRKYNLPTWDEIDGPL